MNKPKLLTVLIASGLIITACGGDDDDSAATRPTTSTTVTTSYSAPNQDGPAAADTTTVMIATDASLGEYLVDADGRTLYLFEKDEGTTTACTGGCADTWPPIVADGTPTGGDGVDASQLGTADGIVSNQVTYHGHLLYYFAGDMAPGDTNGVGLPSWYAVNPAGTAIENG
jgi:predicted lipoprotein with Yx(FWY)xxD motif